MSIRVLDVFPQNQLLTRRLGPGSLENHLKKQASEDLTIRFKKAKSLKAFYTIMLMVCMICRWEQKKLMQ